MNVDQVKLDDDGEAKFTVTCNACGLTDVEIHNSIGGSDETGMWGSIDLHCKACGAIKEIWSA